MDRVKTKSTGMDLGAGVTAKSGSARAGFAERLRQLIAEFPGRGRGLAEAIDMSPAVLSKWSRGETEPTLESLIDIATATSVELGWLMTGRGSMRGGAAAPAPGDPVKLPLYDELSVSAGEGRVPRSEHTADLALTPAQLRAWGVDPAHAGVVRVKGDSMRPALDDGDQIIVDMREGQRVGDGVFVIAIEDALLVKRIQRLSDGTIRVLSENPAYQPETIAGDDRKRLRIVGRVAGVLKGGLPDPSR